MLFTTLLVGATIIFVFKLFEFFTSNLVSSFASLFAPNLNHLPPGPLVFSK